MVFKINISHKGKTFQLETESESIVGKKIGEKIKGENISPDLKEYELEITGISDIAGLPGFKGLEGTAYHRRLLTRGPGMHNTKKGLRLRKKNRGEEISLKISQINTKILKQGTKKFEDFLSKKDSPKESETKPEEKPAEEKPAEEKKEEVKTEEKQEQTEEQAKPEEKPAEEKKEEKPAEEKEETK